MGIATNVLGILKLATGAARIGRGGSTVDADLTTLESAQTTTSNALTAEQAKVATLQRQVMPLARAVRVALTASTTLPGILQLSNVQCNMGTRNFSIEWEGSLPDWTPSATQYLDSKNVFGGAGYYLAVLTSGVLNLVLRNSSGDQKLFNSTAVTGLSDGAAAKIVVSIIRETASVPGSITFYVNGYQLGDVISIAASEPYNLDSTTNRVVSGLGTVRTACDWQLSRLHNHALSASEVVSLWLNGPALADREASQVPILTGNDSTFAGASNWLGGAATKTDAYDSGDAGHSTTLRLQRTGTNGRGQINVNSVYGRNITNRRVTLEFDYKVVTPGAVEIGVYSESSFSESTRHAQYIRSSGTWYEDNILEFVALSDTIYIVIQTSSGEILLDNATLDSTGIVSELLASNAQSNTGQLFDTSGNGNHAVLPSSGARIEPHPSGLLSVESVHEWNGTKEGQYLSLVNQPIIPANAYIERVVIEIVGTPVDGTLGDGVDIDRYCRLDQNTGLIEGVNTLALAERTTDGTNRKLVWTPDQNFTGTIRARVYFTVPRV